LISWLQVGEDINMQLKILAEAYAYGLKHVGSDIKIVSQNPISTYKGFDAYQIQIVWQYREKYTMTTIVHLIAKDNKAIQLAGHTVYSIDGLIDIFQNIYLDP
jgi:hypothetical protein